MIWPGDADPLVAEGAHGHHPALALAAQPVVDRDVDVGEVDLVEHLVAGHVADGAALDARGLEVDDEGGDALVLGPALDGGRVGAEQEQAPLGQVRGRDPDLLAVDHVVVAVEDGHGAEVGQVVAGVGLGEPLAPVLVGVEDRGEPAVLLLLGAPLDEHRADLPDAVGVVHPRCPVLGHDLRVEEALDRRGLPAAPLRRPVDGGPAALVQHALPGLAALLGRDAGVPLVFVLRLGQELLEVLVEPAPQLVAEGLVLGGQGEVHGRECSERLRRSGCEPGR